MLNDIKMRILWWINLYNKTCIFWLILIVIIVLSTIGCIVVEKIKIINKIAIIIRRILIVIEAILAIAFPIYVGKNTWKDLNIEHPFLTVIGFVFLKGIMDCITYVIFFRKTKK